MLASYARDGEKRDEGPTLSTALRERLRRSSTPIPVRLAFRGEELWGEIRPAPEGFRLVAIPGPDFLGRLLTAALLIPGIVLLYAIAGFLMVWRVLATGVDQRQDSLPRLARTFRGRLVALFVGGVMVPLVAVTFFLRSTILTHSEQDTLDHARTGLDTARRVLDDYLPSESGGRGNLRALDDVIGWLANSVGYDLSIYAPDSTLAATSRRDLYAAGLVPDRVPATAYVTIGLGGGAQFVGSRIVSEATVSKRSRRRSRGTGRPRREEPGCCLCSFCRSAVWRSRGLRADGGRLGLQLLVFFFSALVAGRLALRVARPVRRPGRGDPRGGEGRLLPAPGGAPWTKN